MKKIAFFALFMMITSTLWGILPDVKGELDFSNKYRFKRSVVEADTLFLHPTAEISWLGATAGIWGQVDLTENSDTLKETDLYIGYTLPIIPSLINISGTLFYYTFDDEDTPNDLELKIRGEISLLGMVKAFTEHYVKLKEDLGGYYANVGAELDLDIPMMPIGFVARMDVSFGSEDGIGFGADGAGLKAFNASAGILFTLIPMTYIKAHIDFTTELNSDIQDAFDTAKMDTEHIFGGIAIGIKF